MNGDSFRNKRNGFETMDGGQAKKPKSGGKMIALAVVAVVALVCGEKGKHHNPGLCHRL